LDTKNHSDHTLPLSDYLYHLLKQRIENAEGEYVFHARHGNGHLRSVETAVKLITAESGVEFCRQDLRRTFITIAESLDIPAYALKRLLNHSLVSDVTAGYIIADVERLQKPMQKITDFILKTAGQIKS
jgi:integrase